MYDLLPEFRDDREETVRHALTLADAFREEGALIGAALVIDVTCDKLNVHGVGRQTTDELIRKVAGDMVIEAAELELLHG